MFQLWEAADDDKRTMPFCEILYLFARWYDNTSPLEGLKNWKDLEGLEWKGDKLQEKLACMQHWEDIAGDIGTAEINRRENEVHDI